MSAATDDQAVIDSLELGAKHAAAFTQKPARAALLARAARCVPPARRAAAAPLLLDIVTKCPEAHLDVLATYVGAGKLDKVRLGAALQFAAKHKADAALDCAALDAAAGVGVVVTADEIAAAVERELAAREAEVRELRYHFALGKVLGPATKRLRWADGALVRAEAERQLAARLGPRTAADDAPRVKAKKAKKDKAAPTSAVKRGGAVKAAAEAGIGALAAAGHDFPPPAANAAGNKPHLLKAHLAATGGKVMTRFPPEPNGYLHIGHAKAQFLDFGYAKKLGGECVLRYDDTNPEAESQEYIDSILASVHWLGHEPARITYSSDYFDTLYALAVKLIKRGLAYVCHQTGAESAEGRRTRTDSPWRDRPVAENLKLFHEMRCGAFAEGEAWLRMKIDMKSDNPCMRDPCAYRIKYHEHPRTGDKWCVYPSYDFTHCLVDSLENITHSLCTLEFDIRREAYYWLIDALDMYRPLVWEFSRLQFEDKVWLDDAKGEEREWLLKTTLSKRRLLAAVNSGKARGWDDPRMPTLEGLKRRGFTPESINNLIDSCGVTRGQQRIPFRRLEGELRNDLDPKVERRMAVLKPLKVTALNYDDVALRTVTLPIHPLHKERGERKLPFTKTFFIDHDDFRLKDDPDYYGLAPNKEVGLRYAANFTCTEVIKDDTGAVVELRGTLDPEKKNKTKGHLHWLPDPAESSGASRRVEVRLYEWLFHTCSAAPVVDEKKAADAAADDDEAAAAKVRAAAAARAEANVDGEKDDDDDDADDAAGNVESRDPVDREIVLSDALVESSVGSEPLTRYQFERTGYFVVDSDTTADKLVLNRICTLKESSAKKRLRK